MNLGIEDETLEFKKTTGELNEAMNSICAMLNKNGHGTVFFGVHPTGEVKGQEVSDATLRDVSRKIYETIVPQIVPKIDKRNFDGHEVIEVSFSGNDKPYSCKGIYYIRTADEDRILPPHELRQMFEYNHNASWDKQLTEFSVQDIQQSSFEKFYKRALASNRLKDENADISTVLTKLGLLVDGKLTNAAYYLLSDRNPIVLKMAIFATNEKLTFLDINRIKGNIIDLIDIAYNYIREHILWRARIVGLKREEIPEIPVKALREIICNSFAHANYNTNTEHEIDIHPGKVVIYNPGAFPIGYDPEDFVKENLQSMVRNPLILDTLYLSEDVEAYGSGLKNVYSECEANHTSVSYEKYKDGFSFIFKRENGSNSGSNGSNQIAEISEDEQRILRALEENPRMTIRDLAKRISKSERSIQRILNGLKEKGCIERIGGTRGFWQVIISDSIENSR